MSGFVALPRAILNSLASDAWFPGSPKASIVYAVLVNLANWSDAVGVLPKQQVPLKAGQLVTSQGQVSKLTGYSRQEVRQALGKLEAIAKINQVSNQHGTIITILDYEELYLDKQVQQPTQQPTYNQPTTNEQPYQDKKTRRQEDKEDILSSTSSTPLRLVIKKEADHSIQLVEIWNAHRGTLRASAKLTDARRRKMRSRWTEEPTPEYWIAAVQKMATSSFCQEGSWATFDWLIKNGENHSKVAAGNYDDKNVTLQSQDWRDLLTPEERARL